MKLLAALTLVLLQSVPSFSPQPELQRGRIEGFVLRIGSDEPIAGAEVTLTGTANNAARVSISPATTDSLGRFTINDLEAGTYRLTVVSNGYARQDFGQRAPSMPGAPIVLTAGQVLNMIAIHLTPAGSVSGHIRSSNNRPLAGIPVQLLRRTYDSNGNRTFQPAGSARTNDLGEYRFYWMTPGRYYVMAGQGPLSDRRGSSLRQDESANEVVDEYPYTFFPGSTQIDKAVPIDLKPGASLEAVELMLAPPHHYRITARVVDSITGQPPRQAAVTLSFWRSSISSTGFYDAKTGAIEFKDIVPGSYSISVTAYEGAGITGAASKRRTADPSAGRDTVVRDSDVDLGVLIVEPPNLVRGQIRIEGNADNALSMDSLQMFLLTPSDTGAGSVETLNIPFRTSVQGNGTFIGYFPEESIRVSVSGLPPGFYVREAKLNAMDALVNFAPVSRNNELVIILSSDGGEITGVVRDERMTPAAGVQAVLVPNTLRNVPELFKTAISDQEGRVRMVGIAPGDYKLFVWEALEPNSFLDPQVLQKYEQKGRPIHVAGSSHEALDLKMIPAQGE